jgi:spermidine synthase
VIASAVLLSGAAALIFQVLWLYEAGLVFGNTVWAASIVLAAFMGGLAIGNAIVSRIADRLTRGLRVYAGLELIVAGSGVALTYVLPRLVLFVAPLTAAAGDRTWLVNGVRLAVAFLILLLPSIAMGATLPIVVGTIGRSHAQFGRVLGWLYGWNTLGAVAGVLSAELVLVNRVGVHGSAWVAAVCDIAAAGLALRCGAIPSAFARATARPAALQIHGLHRLLACAFLSGGALLALEVLWFRFLTLYVLSTTLAVGLMLAVVLMAIALGGFAASALVKNISVTRWLPFAAIAMSISVVLTYVAFQWLTSGTQIGAAARLLWMTVALAGPTSFLSGIFFTVTGTAIEQRLQNSTRGAALLTLANTCGAMCGPLVAAFVLLPNVGVETSLLIVAMLYAGVALVIPRTPERRTVLTAVLMLAVVCVAVRSIGLSDRYFVRSAAAYSSDGSEIVATREGRSESIFLMEQRWLGKPVYDRLVTNGFSMSGTAVPAMRYMRYFAYWPMLVHAAPLRRALVICYGVGVTAGAVTDISSLEAIDVVEISQDVVDMSDVIYANGRHPLHDPRVRLHIEDGRSYLQTTQNRFDLITGEPPPPRTPGAVNIYTREYFQLVFDHLEEGGMTTYWVPVARPDPGTDVDTIIRAFCDVFEDCSLWNGTPYDLMLVGSHHARGPFDAAAFSKPWTTPGLEARLREVGFEAPEEIGATFVGDAAYLHTLTADTPPLLDDFPQRLLPSPSRPSLSDPRYATDSTVADRFRRVIDPERARELFTSSPLIRRLWPDELIQRSLPAFGYQRIINRVILEGGQPLRQIDDLDFLLTQTTLRTLPLWVLGSDDVKARIADTSKEQTGSVKYARALRALTGRDYASAAALFADAARLGLEGATVRPLRVYALCRAGQVETARALAGTLAAGTPDEQHFWAWMTAAFGVRAGQ